MAADTRIRPGAGPSTDPATASPLAVARGVLRDQRRSLVMWSVAIVAVCGIYITFYPAIGAEQMGEMADMIPEDLATALGYDRMGDAAGYLTSTVFGLLGPVLLLVFAIATGARLLAGGEEDGSLELELTHPVSRRAVYLERLAGLWANVAILVAVLAVVSTALVLTLDLDVTVAGMMAGSLGMLLFVLAHATVAFAVGAATGRRAIGVAVAAALAVVGYIGDAIGPMVDGAGWLETISPWSWFLGGDPLVEGVDLGGYALLLGLTLVTAVLGLLRFRRRDLGV
jgi:ABC-2 type transport system permease protein